MVGGSGTAAGSDSTTHLPLGTDPILVAPAERTAPPPLFSQALVTAHVTGGLHYVRRSPGERRTLPLLCGGGRRHFPPRRLVEDRQSDRWRFSRPLVASLHHPVMQTGLRAPLRPRWGWGSPPAFSAESSSSKHGPICPVRFSEDRFLVIARDCRAPFPGGAGLGSVSYPQAALPIPVATEVSFSRGTIMHDLGRAQNVFEPRYLGRGNIFQLRWGFGGEVASREVNTLRLQTQLWVSWEHFLCFIVPFLLTFN